MKKAKKAKKAKKSKVTEARSKAFEKSVTPQAWQLTMEEVVPAHKFRCTECGLQRESIPTPGRVPFCLKCLDNALLHLGLKAMKDLGPVKVKQPIQSFGMPAVSFGAACAVKAGKKGKKGKKGK